MSQDTTRDRTVSQGPAEISDGIFARRLYALRKAAGLTQQQLASAMSAAGNTMHRSAVAKIEAGDRAVSVGEAFQLAGVLGVGLAELVTDPGPGPGPVTVQEWEEQRAHRARVEARVEAQVRVRGLQYEAAERHKVLEEDRILYENTMDRLRAAERRVAELGGEVPPPPPAFEQDLAAASRPLALGKDDQ